MGPGARAISTRSMLLARIGIQRAGRGLGWLLLCMAVAMSFATGPRRLRFDSSSAARGGGAHRLGSRAGMLRGEPGPLMLLRLRGGKPPTGAPGSRAVYFDDDGVEKRPPARTLAPLRAGKNRTGPEDESSHRDGSEWSSEPDDQVGKGPVDDSLGSADDGENVGGELHEQRFGSDSQEVSLDEEGVMERAGGRVEREESVDCLEDDENYQRLLNQPEIEDFNHEDEGFNQNPFCGVKMEGWFMAENVDPPSEDPKIRALNEALWEACEEGDADEALRLIQQGAEVNAADPMQGWDWSALMHACAPRPAAGLPNVLCNETARVVEEKRLRLVDCLMEHGARIDVTDIYGETPLHYAAVRGYPKLTERLIELGVDIHRENMYGCSAQRIAEINQKDNPGCWAAAEVIANAGGYDAGWPDRGSIHVTKEMGEKEKEWIQMHQDADWDGAKEDAERQKSLRRIQEDAFKQAKKFQERAEFGASEADDDGPMPE